MSSSDQPRPKAARQMTVRPTPKLVPFLVAGVVAALIAAAVVVLTTEPAEDYTPAASFGYLTFTFALPALALAAVAWLLIERRSRRRARTYDAAVTGHRHGAADDAGPADEPGRSAPGPDSVPPGTDTTAVPTERTDENGPR